MACDHAYTHPDGMQFQGGPKMIKLNKKAAQVLFKADKAVVGGAGSANDLGNAWSWLDDPNENIPKVKHSQFLALTNNGIYISSNLNNWILVDQPYYSIGSGSHYAVGVLAAGKNPSKAVAVASIHDPGTGFGVTEYKV